MKVSAARLSQIPQLALLVAGSTLMASEASADGKLVPATVCQPLVQINTNPLATEAAILADQADAVERIANIRYSVNGRVLNQSSTTRFGVVCPIVRDNLKQPLNWIRVLCADNHLDPPMPSADRREVLECEVRVAAGLATGTSDKQRCESNTKECPFDVPTGFGTGTGYWQFKELDIVSSADDANNLNNVYRFSHYTLVCQIPPRDGHNGPFSWIAGIMIDEP